jgi:hypothetical protein
MRARLLAVAILSLAALVLAACGASNDELNVKEGEPVTLGDLRYNVTITRFLNPSDEEDRAYLLGQPPQANDKLYLGVFMQIENEGDSPQTIPTGFKVTDTQHNEYLPVKSRSAFALDLGGPIPPNGEVPELETAAARGPIEGGMVLFVIQDASTENRPLELEIPSSSGESGEVELDI